MGVNSLPKTATQQCDGCDLNPDPSAPESSTLTTQVAATLMQTKIKNVVNGPLSNSLFAREVGWQNGAQKVGKCEQDGQISKGV